MANKTINNYVKKKCKKGRQWRLRDSRPTFSEKPTFEWQLAHEEYYLLFDFLTKSFSCPHQIANVAEPSLLLPTEAPVACV